MLAKGTVSGQPFHSKLIHLLMERNFHKCIGYKIHTMPNPSTLAKMCSTTKKQTEIPSHVLALYDRAIVNCASLPRQKLVESFAEIQAIYPQYPVPYLHWLGTAVSQSSGQKVAIRSHDGNGIDLPDREGQYDRTGAVRPAIGAEKESKTAAN
ncbi:hypothetical protein HII31_01686 [Pseudocercospora fuligena]|uniref:Uncharacterized protein n=1 Tax=Pseudocercospora fuligena TaxID=685502 RepID=A0A8H6RVI4_9PEZI|nr:hypothetical protein HII31_01686 [Pseudocercospora fuligena]